MCINVVSGFVILYSIQVQHMFVVSSVIFVNENENENEKDQQFVHEN